MVAHEQTKKALRLEIGVFLVFCVFKRSIGRRVNHVVL